MKVTITFDFGNKELRAIANQYGENRPATRREVEGWLISIVESTKDDLIGDLEKTMSKAERENVG